MMEKLIREYKEPLVFWNWLPRGENDILTHVQIANFTYSVYEVGISETIMLSRQAMHLIRSGYLIKKLHCSSSPMLLQQKSFIKLQ